MINVLIILFGFSMIINMTRPIIVLYASELGASTFVVGTLTAVYAFFPLIIAIHAGKIADRIGDRIPVGFGMCGVAAGMTMPLLFPAMWSLYLSQVIVGISHLFVILSLQNVAGQSAAPGKSEQSFGWFSSTVAAATFVGPFTGGYLADHLSFSSVFLVALTMTAIPIALSLTLPVRRQGMVRQSISLRNSIGLLKIPELRVALISSALVLYSRDIFATYFPLYGKSLNMSISAIGWVLSIQGLSMIVVRLVLFKLSEAFGRNRILKVSIFIAAAAFLLIPVAKSFYLLALLAVLLGFGLGCGQPLSMATTYNASPKSRTGEVLGLRLTFNRLSQLTAPLFFGMIGSLAGVMSVFFVSGAVLLGGSYVVRSNRKVEP